ncbi:branched-chain amino acid ABC transporter permease [bacterium]|nr:branched-chain amino acid ABC transporter permease [bacterium]
MDLIAQSIVIGLTEHGPLVLAAMGFALLYRLTGLINVAFAETVTLGAYIGMWINTTFGLTFWLAIWPAAIAAGLISVATYFAVFRPAKRRDVGMLEMIIMSFGLSIVLRYSLQFVFGYGFVYYDVPAQQGWRVFDVGVSRIKSVSLVIVVVLALVLFWFIQKTEMGQKIRALASDEKLAQVSGINPLAVTVMVWFIAGVAGGLAGAFYGVGQGFKYTLGWDQFLFIMLVMLVGGAKNIRGVIIAGLGTGIVISALSLWLKDTQVATVILIALFMAYLKVRQRSLVEGKV